MRAHSRATSLTSPHEIPDLIRYLMGLLPQAPSRCFGLRGGDTAGGGLLTHFVTNKSHDTLYCGQIHAFGQRTCQVAAQMP